MFKNYLKLSYRNLIKNISFSLINIIGLSLGIACCILILGYIGYELSYDSHHQNTDNIYRIASIQTSENRVTEQATCPAPVGPTMMKDYPEIVDAVRFMPTVQRMFRYEDKDFYQSGVIYADQSVFNVFSFELVEGDPETALELPFTMVITEKAAKKYFGDESPVGKVMIWDTRFEYTITGVVKDLPLNLHFQFDVLASFATLIKYSASIGSSWTNWGFNTYLLLNDKTDINALENKIKLFNKQYLEPTLDPLGIQLSTYLQPLRSIHLYSDIQDELGTNSNIRVIYIFSAIGIVILLIACINFINLTTSRSSGRIMEVGIRKVLGAERKSLILQFLTESFILTLISIIIGLFLALIALPYFNNIAARQISIDYYKLDLLIPAIFGIIIFVGIFAGSYPALFLSRFNPVQTLKGVLKRSTRGILLRSSLIVFQFIISVTLVIFTLVILGQQKYQQEKNLGFNKDNMLVAPVHNDFARIRLETFKTELLKINHVENATGSSMVPGDTYLFDVGVYPEDFSRENIFQMDNYLVDADYFNTYEIEIIEGRNFLKDNINDIANSVLINETARTIFEWNEAVGKTLQLPITDSTSINLRVIGVYKDINHRSLYSVIAPTFIQHTKTSGPINNRSRRLTIHLDGEDIPNTINMIKKKWNEFFPDHPFYYFFLKDSYEGYHKSEGELATVVRSFSILAIIIAILGLFGLASYITEKKTKEIGIRKAIGSSSLTVVLLLCKQFILLVLLANIISWPITYIIINKWLRNFAYPVEQELNIYLLTGVFSVALAFLTVIFQSLKAARTIPAETLRYE